MKKVNIVYDFDGTLTKNAAPRYLILEKCNYENGTDNKQFLKEVENIKISKKCETVEAFYERFFEILNQNNMEITEMDFNYGVDNIQFNQGLEKYFEIINSFATNKDIQLNHFILTSGIKAYIENCKYSRYFKDIFGSTFSVQNNIIIGLDYCLNTKEKISKLQCLQENAETKADKTIYVGDGFTDYYAMKYIHNNCGSTIFVHQNEHDLDIYNELKKENIIDYCEIADYTENSKLYQAICEAITE